MSNPRSSKALSARSNAASPSTVSRDGFGDPPLRVGLVECRFECRPPITEFHAVGSKEVREK